MNEQNVTGEFLTKDGERFYVINHSEKMTPFFISLISDSDHWLFVSSTGGLTAGRVSPETALFPYVSVDKVYESAPHTGCKTALNIHKDGQCIGWEPFNSDFNHPFNIRQNLYKNTLGDKICFEEINLDLQLVFRYTWNTSDEFGFARQCELENLGHESLNIEMIDGLQNILPAGTPRFTQSVSSNLVDAYKWSEVNQQSGLGIFALYSGITDRAEPCESLKANTVFALGFTQPKILLCTDQLQKFRRNEALTSEQNKRGVRGAFLINVDFDLAPKQIQKWQIVANLEQDQKQVCSLIEALAEPLKVASNIEQSIQLGSDALARIMARGDSLQLTNEENVSVHHYANTLFNNLRGGVFDNQYMLSSEDFLATLRTFNIEVYLRHKQALSQLPEHIHITNMRPLIQTLNDPQLTRLAGEYLPITFGRRHGDPSRPWNQFAIKLKDDAGKPLLSYEGNWRDIFQNWEALTFSYPEFVESVIAKFVNASTIDGYNPYRITKDGIDWEVEEPDDPWSYIGYWGDHQIIYLLKMLELSKEFNPARLSNLLDQPIYSYANVPYRLNSFDAMLKDAKNTVTYDQNSADRIDLKVASLGADGKLIADANGQVYQVNLLEKLLVPLLCKLGNLVVDGGIWLNSQRPEWNDANNALVGQGLSMVTLNYLRRYICFMQDLISHKDGLSQVSGEVVNWFDDTSLVLQALVPKLQGQAVSAKLRFEVLNDLGQAACRYRQAVYKNEGFADKADLSYSQVKVLLTSALVAIDHSIATNLGDDGLYHAYNLLKLDGQQAGIEHLYPMLEGQVAVLSSGAISPEQAITVLDALFASDVYREDQHSFMLYPDRPQLGFLNKNTISASQVANIEVLTQMLAAQDQRIVLQDVQGTYRFNANLTNITELRAQLTELGESYGKLDTQTLTAIEEVFEQVFNHQAFTGRSGGMFGFEGLGCVYWHMVSKLLLAVKENFYIGVEQNAQPQSIQRLGELYYAVRDGIGFNKTPEQYGAFPCDPYSHTPKHAGAQQPGMTGQVKEEILSRFGELGIVVKQGVVHFIPKLLRGREFVKTPQDFRFLDVADQWQQLSVPANGLAFTWCQVPVVYEITTGKPIVNIQFFDGKIQQLDELYLDQQLSQELFSRSGHITGIQISINQEQLLSD